MLRNDHAMLWMLRLAAIARGALRALQWFALASLLAGGVVFMGEWDTRQPLRSLLLAIVGLAPGAVLLHLASVLGSLPSRLRLDRGLPTRSNVMLLGVRITYLLRPWYWSAVGLSLLLSFVLLPLALLRLLGVA